GHEASVHRPEGKAQQTFLPLAVGLQCAQTHQGETQTEHAVDTEEGAVSVHGRRVETLHVEKSDRWVDHEAEDSAPHQLPDANRDEEVDGPTILARPFSATGDLQVPH